MELNLSKYNRHFEKGFCYPYPKTRFIFQSLVNQLFKRQILEVTGLRRVGKSTLIFQLINHLLEKQTDNFSILYFTFDEAQPSLDDLFNAYFQQTQKDFKNEKIFVFLDEIQKLTNFENQLKVYYDLYPNIKFVISGSAGLFIRKKSQESLAGRIFPKFVLPLSFPEYLFFKEKENLIKKPMLYAAQLENEFLLYLESQFVESIFMKDKQDRKNYYEGIAKKIIFEDLPLIYKFDNPLVMWKIIKFLAAKPGMIVNNIHLAEELQISNKTLALYFSYLENSFLIKKYLNFSKNIQSSEKRLKRYYLSSPSFSFYLADFPDKSLLFENYYASVSQDAYFFRDPQGHEVDFVGAENSIIFPTEVKFKKQLVEQDVANLRFFLQKNKYGTGQIVYMGSEEKQIKNENVTIKYKPYYKILSPS
jgi:hypothetical protein